MGLLLFSLAMIPTGIVYSMVFLALRQQTREMRLICRTLNHLLTLVAEEEI